MEVSTEVLAALSILAFLLVIGLISFLIFLCWKVYQQHLRLNKLEETIEKLLNAKYSNKLNTELYAVEEESVQYRRKGDNDSAIDLGDLDLRNNSGGSNHTDKTSIGPRLTINIEKEVFEVMRKETANVYGHVLPHDSQIVAIAQGYYKERTKSQDLVGIDDMDISDHQVKKSDPKSRQNVIPEERPMSVLIDESMPFGINNSKEQGVFVHKTLTQSGGELNCFGIKLEIPNGALNQSTKITLGISWDVSLYPSLSKSHALLSPVIVCQPSIKFLKQVKLSFPHCAVNYEENWKLTMRFRDNCLHDNDCEWRQLENGGNSYFKVSKHSVALFVNHFTLYTLTGESMPGKTAVKAVKLLAFTSPFEIDSMFNVRIYCINDYDEDSFEMKNIVKSSKQLKEKQADVPQPLFIQDNGEDISVDLTKLCNGWENDGDANKKIDFESIWHCLAPSCKYIFHPNETSVRKIVCEFSYHQKPSTKKRVLQLADEYKQHLPLALKRNLPNEQKKMKSLILKLDPRGENDYTVLAEKIGYTCEEIKWLEEQKGNKSPTEVLLEKWIHDGNQLKDLQKYLQEMGRLDAVSVLQDDSET